MEKETGYSERKRRLAAAANMPEDVVLGASVMSVLGNCEVCIENYRGLLEYTECMIRVQTKNYQIRLCGTGLRIESYTKDEMKISGVIQCIEFCR